MDYYHAYKNRPQQQLNSVAQGIISVTEGEFNGLVTKNGRLALKFARLNKGEIDLEASGFKQLFSLALESNAGVEATKAGARKSFNKLIEEGLDPKIFDSIEENYQQVKGILQDKLTTVEGIKDLMKESIKYDAVQKISAKTETPEGKEGQLSTNEHRKLHGQLKDQINISDDTLEHIIKWEELSAESENISKKIMHKHLYIEGKNVLDTSKLTPENIQKCGQEISNTLEREVSSYAILKDTFKSMEKEQNITITPERTQKITNALKPALMKLDPAYLKEHKEEINQEISKSLNKGKTFLSIFRKEFAISGEELNKIAENISKKHLPLSDKEQAAKVSKDKPESKVEKDSPKPSMKRASIEFANKIRANLQNKFQLKGNPKKVSPPTMSKEAIQKNNQQDKGNTR